MERFRLKRSKNSAAVQGQIFLKGSDLSPVEDSTDSMGLKLCDANLVVYLHPSKAKNIPQAVLRELSSLLFKFNENFDGVVLAHSASFLGELGKILPGIHPYFGVRLTTKLLLFNPMVNMLLEGKVVRIGPQSIHSVVLGFSSAIIIEEDIREEFKYRIKHGKELYTSASHRRHKIEVGSIIRFIVKKFDEEVLHITGSLLQANTGSIHFLDRNVEDNSHADSTKKRDNKDMTDKETSSINTDHRIKKSRREDGDS